MAEPRRHTVRLSLCPTWEHISEVRTFFISLCGALPEDRAEAVGMTVHELLENAVRNGADGNATVTLSYDLDADALEVTVENRALPEHRERLEEMKQMLEKHDDAQALFLELMRRSVGKAGSGLGLARIFYEGQLRVGIHLQGDTVRVVASGRARG